MGTVRSQAVPQSTARAPLAVFALLAVLLMLLQGCSNSRYPDVPLALRNPTVPIGGTSRFDAHRFAGTWQTVGCLGSCDATVRYALGGDGTYVRETEQGREIYTLGAPGVLRAVDSADVLVVMWVDEGFRTAAIGDAQGRWAAILDRTGHGGVDRVAAAREILDFNGWDTSSL